ncbi:hypothetical protein RchiOBHm_Chr0c31g0501351 [Rosa chinensis]|uniref:Uncharacterized protein n=1 Tax=Rosa chinensis TaxID=74649 RepID=A0A2P6SQ92_ROSCH|nr:hypothetical protein RchiOBHm_Chr0c31g0501351 [Rosa chinensis]
MLNRNHHHCHNQVLLVTSKQVENLEVENQSCNQVENLEEENQSCNQVENLEEENQSCN